MEKLLRKIKNNSTYFFLWIMLIPMYISLQGSFPPPGIDDRLKPYVKRFEDWGKWARKNDSYKVPKLNIAIGPINDFNLGLISPGAIGVCYYLAKPRAILINESFWNNASDIEKEMVIFHELGHCALSRMHTTSIGPWRNRMSLMYPIIFSSNVYRRNRAYYMDELFNPY